MPTHIQFHRSNIHGATPDVKYLLEGEPAVNLYDKKLWVKGVSGDLITFIDGTTGERVAGSNTEIQYKSESGFSASGKLVFDGFGLVADGATFDNDILINDVLVGKGSGSNPLNTAVGKDALESNAGGLQNVAVGTEALQYNTVGVSNTGVGYRAGKEITTGIANTALGQGALQNTGTGDSNTGIGQRALDANTRGEENTALGALSLFKNTEGVKNIAVGNQSLYSNEHEVVARVGDETNWANCNTAVGYQSAYSNTTGDYNTGVGFKSLFYADGLANTAIGASAGKDVYSGNFNTAIGASAGAAVLVGKKVTGNNNTWIGHHSQPSVDTVNNEITLGNKNVDTIRTGDGGFVVTTSTVNPGISAEGATFGGRVNLKGHVKFHQSGLSILDNNENSIFRVVGDRRIQIGDGDNSGNGTNIHIRDSGETIQMNAPYVEFKEDLTHFGDSNTKINFSTDNINLHAGGVTFASGHVNQLVLPLGLSADAGATFGGAVKFDENVTVDANFLYINDALAHNGDTDTKLVFGTNNTSIQSGGTKFLEGNANGVLHAPGGFSGGAGATFGGVIGITGGSPIPAENYIKFPDGTTLGSTQTETIGISVSNGTQVLTVGKKGHRHLPDDCSVTDWTVTSTDTGSITWDINWCTYADWPSTATVDMHASETPLLSSANKNTSPGSIPAGKWNKRYFKAGEIIEFEIDSVSTLTNCTLSLTIVRGDAVGGNL